MINKKSEGFIALLPALIISSLLVSIIFVENETVFMSKMNQIETNYKIISKNLAESCMNVARLRISENDNYNGLENIQIEKDQCRIGTVEYFHNNLDSYFVVINTSSNYSGAYTNLKAELSYSSLSSKNEMNLISKTEMP